MKSRRLIWQETQLGILHQLLSQIRHKDTVPAADAAAASVALIALVNALLLMLLLMMTLVCFSLLLPHSYVLHLPLPPTNIIVWAFVHPISI